MQFIVNGIDGRDIGAVQRRLDCREAHLKKAELLKSQGNLLFASAILSEQGQMIGSIMIMEFPERQDLDAWLEDEPYVKGGVWQSVTVQPCRVAPMFSQVKAGN